MTKAIKIILKVFLSLFILAVLIIGGMLGATRYKKNEYKKKRIPEGSQSLIIQKYFSNNLSDKAEKLTTAIGWPVQQEFQKDARDFYHWPMNMRYDREEYKDILFNGQTPVFSVVFENSNIAEKPALAVFSGSVEMEGCISGGGLDYGIAKVVLKNKNYTAMYENLIADKNCSVINTQNNKEVSKGDVIGYILGFPTYIFEEGFEDFFKEEAVGKYNFKFYVTKNNSEGSSSPVHLSKEMFDKDFMGNDLSIIATSTEPYHWDVRGVEIKNPNGEAGITGTAIERISMYTAYKNRGVLKEFYSSLMKHLFSNSYIDGDAEFGVSIRLTKEGAEIMRNITGKNVGKKLPIYVNGETIATPAIQEVFPVSENEEIVLIRNSKKEAQTMITIFETGMNYDKSRSQN